MYIKIKDMRLCAILIVILGTSVNVYGLTCYSCSGGDFNGETDRTGVCYSPSSATPKPTCPPNSGSNIYYCRTMFTISDGVVIDVNRGCVGSTFDEDDFTGGVPANEKCETQLNEVGDTTDTTSCYYHCNEDNCNSRTTDTLKACNSNCNYPYGNCNYITGNCVCNPLYSGDSCSDTVPTPTPTAQRKCIQCNTATDGSCTSSTAISDCPSTQNYCSTATTSIYDESDNVVSTLTTRGCTSSFTAVDECTFTNIYTDNGITSAGYNEFTCYSTCDTDGCNGNNANGLVDGDEEVLMECVQCTGTYSDCSSGRTICPSGTTHCKSTVVYLITDRVDSRYKEDPDFKLVSVVRECATEAVTTECTESTVGDLSFKKVTCTETCQDDVCNTGWPARPKCVMCGSSSTDYADGYDTCFENPPIPRNCPDPYHKYCYIQETGIAKSSRARVQGYPHAIRRGCSYLDIGTGCSTERPRGTDIQSCNRTCTTDGCNVGSGGSMLLQTFTFVVVTTIIGWMVRTNL